MDLTIDISYIFSMTGKSWQMMKNEGFDYHTCLGQNGD